MVGGSPRSVYGPVLDLWGDLWGRESRRGSIRGKTTLCGSALVLSPTPRKGPSVGAGLKDDASCAGPGDRSVKKRVGRAGSGRGAVQCASGSGGSVRLSAQTSSRSRPTCRRRASPLGGEEALSATLRPTPPPSASESGRTPLLSLGRYQGEASEAPSAQNVGRRALSGEGPDSAATSGLCDLDLSSVPAFGAKPVLIFWTQVVSPTPLASFPVPYYPAPES